MARSTGNPALAGAFKLDKLYQSRAPGADEGEDHEGEGDDEAPEAAPEAKPGEK